LRRRPPVYVGSVMTASGVQRERRMRRNVKRAVGRGDGLRKQS
jgi:hypothetical protein